MGPVAAKPLLVDVWDLFKGIRSPTKAGNQQGTAEEHGGKRECKKPKGNIKVADISITPATAFWCMMNGPCIGLKATASAKFQIQPQGEIYPSGTRTNLRNAEPTSTPKNLVGRESSYLKQVEIPLHRTTKARRKH